jgi:hypothetical protein
MEFLLLPFIGMTHNTIKNILNADLTNLPLKGKWQQYVTHPFNIQKP